MRNALINQLAKSSTLRRVRHRLVGRYRNPNLYTGEFGSFAEARAAIPAGRPVGYDSAEMASWYRERLDAVQPEDYPVLFWLARVVPEVKTVFDFGGHVGLHYFSWQRLVAWPKGLRWTVGEVAAVVEAGRAVARERNAEGSLSFTTEVRDANGAGVFVASGSVQYLEPGFLWHALGALERRPRHLLFNKLPVHESRDFVTIQDAGASFHPYSVVARGTLEHELARLGYERIDAWKNPGLDCLVYLRRDLHVSSYSGAYWRLREASA